MFLPFPLEISPVQDVFYCICKTTKVLYRTWLTIARPKACAVLDFSLDISKLEAEGEKRRLWLSLLLLGEEPTSLWRWLVSNHSPHTSSHLSTWERLTCSHIVGFQDSRVEMSVLGVDLCPNPIQRQLVLTWPITSVPIFLFLSLLFPCPVMSSRLSSPESRKNLNLSGFSGVTPASFGAYTYSPWKAPQHHTPLWPPLPSKSRSRSSWRNFIQVSSDMCLRCVHPKQILLLWVPIRPSPRGMQEHSSWPPCFHRCPRAPTIHSPHSSLSELFKASILSPFSPEPPRAPNCT